MSDSFLPSKKKHKNYRMPQESINNPKRMVSIERDMRALELRKEGLSFWEIKAESEKWEYSNGVKPYASGEHAAQQITAWNKRFIRDTIEDYRTTIAHRLELMWQKIEEGIVAGNRDDIDLYLKIHDRIAKLHGLNRENESTQSDKPINQLFQLSFGNTPAPESIDIKASQD
jgi:hypothetical protein